MKIKCITTSVFLISQLLNYANAQLQPPIMPGECVPGSSSNPAWFSGNQMLTSSCTDVKIGIGTNYPMFPLHVIGQGHLDQLTTSGIRIGTNVPNSNVGLKIQSSGASQFALTHLIQVGTSPYKKMIFMEIEDPSVEIIKVQNTLGGYTPFLLTSSGGLTIQNSTGKTLQLDANGLLHSRRLKIDTDIWPDYVFESNYKLMSLSEVETFIKLNNHLPNIPSSNEMILNGIDVQEMNVLLLEKIEELTLHLIQLQKEINELKYANKIINTNE